MLGANCSIIVIQMVVIVLSSVPMELSSISRTLFVIDGSRLTVLLPLQILIDGSRL